MLPIRTTALTVAGAAMLLAAPSALAAPSSESTPLNLPSSGAQASSSGGTGGGLVRTVVGLAVVLAVIYGLTWVLKQVKASRESSASGDGLGLAPVASIPLGPGRSLHLVRAGREVMLLGVSEHAVVPIRAYDEDEARDLGMIPDEPDGGDPAAPAPTGLALRDVVERIRQRTVRS